MDRVFNEAEPSLQTAKIRVDPMPDPVINPVPDPLLKTQRSLPPWQQLTLIGITLGALLSSAWMARNWHLSQQALHRERNLALIEKFKTRESPSPISEPRQPEVIATLPNLEPLTLPLSTAIAPATSSLSAGLSRSSAQSSAAGSTPPAPAPASSPLLVGVVHAENGGSAIFQLGDQSLSATPGESIGNSGWSLLSLSSTGAVIERNGQRQSLTVGGAF